MSLTDAELARSFDAEVIPRYGRLFTELAGGALPKHQESLAILDMACATGFALLPLLAAVPKASRVVAISDDRFALKVLHAQLSPELRRHLFVRKEDPRRLPFGNAVFDWAYACWPTRLPENVKQVVRQALRVLRPGGTLTLVAPLENSFIELTTATMAAARASGISDAERVLGERPALLSLDGWEKLVTRSGGIEVRSSKAEVSIPTLPPVSKDPLFAKHVAPLWLGTQLDDVPGLGDALDRAQAGAGALSVSAQIGCIQCTRGLDELSDSTSP